MPMNKLLFASFALTALTVFPACSGPPTNEPDTTKPTTTTIDVTAQWPAPADGAFGEIAVASAGNEGAIAYAAVEDSKTRIMLQRLDHAGAMNGSTIELGVLALDKASRITLASDGIQYIACWAGHDETIACATAPVAEGNASPGLSMAGRWPSIAYGSGGWALGYGIAEQLAVVHLANDGTIKGEPALFAASGGADPEVILKATESGFALLGESAEKMHVFSLDKQLLSISAPIDLGRSSWFHAAMATSGTNIGVTVGKPYGSVLFVLDGKTITGGHEFDEGGDKTGANTAIGADGDSFGIFSADFNVGLHYGLIEEAGLFPPSEIDINGTDASFFRGSLAILQLKEASFVAASQGAYSSGGKIVIARVQRR